MTPREGPHDAGDELVHDGPEARLPDLPCCDICGSADVREIRCKVICGNCRTILQSCADL